MPLRNRVDPFGDLHAVAARGLLTGNRGCLVDDEGAIVRRHQVRRWITCRTEYRGWRHPLAAPRRWTPVFFLDEAVALAAGHRPCALCRRDSYRAYGEAVAEATGGSVPSADELDLRLHDERRSGRGRGGRDAGVGGRPGDGRSLWTADLADLPDATVIVVDGSPVLVVGAPSPPVPLRGLGSTTAAAARPRRTGAGPHPGHQRRRAPERLPAGAPPVGDAQPIRPERGLLVVTTTDPSVHRPLGWRQQKARTSSRRGVPDDAATGGRAARGPAVAVGRPADRPRSHGRGAARRRAGRGLAGPRRAAGAGRRLPPVGRTAGRPPPPADAHRSPHDAPVGLPGLALAALPLLGHGRRHRRRAGQAAPADARRAGPPTPSPRPTATTTPPSPPSPPTRRSSTSTRPAPASGCTRTARSPSTRRSSPSASATRACSASPGVDRRTAPFTDLELRSGDLLVFGGPTRRIYHGVPKAARARHPPGSGSRPAGSASRSARPASPAPDRPARCPHLTVLVAKLPLGGAIS